MQDYVIYTDSTCDLTPELIKELNIKVIPMEFIIEGNNYYNYPDARNISFHEVYDMLREKKSASTGLINTQRFINIFEEDLKNNLDILYICFSSGLSSQYNSSCIAVNELTEKYPDRKIYTIDSLSASLGEGLLVYHAAKQKDKGLNIDELKDWVENNKLNIGHMFTVNDLFHLKRGGRISSATAIVGTMLSIKPVMHTDNEGHLTVIGKAKGRKASLVALFKAMKENAIDPETQTIFIGHGDCIEDAEYLAKMIKTKLNVKEIVINYIGPVIGTHSGPGTVALFYVAKKR